MDPRHLQHLVMQHLTRVPAVWLFGCLASCLASCTGGEENSLGNQQWVWKLEETRMTKGKGTEPAPSNGQPMIPKVKGTDPS